jgi:hypothetical protein
MFKTAAIYLYNMDKNKQLCNTKTCSNCPKTTYFGCEQTGDEAYKTCAIDLEGV